MAEQKDKRGENQPAAGGAVFSQTRALTTRWAAGVSAQSASLSAVQLVTSSALNQQLYHWETSLFSDPSTAETL